MRNIILLSILLWGHIAYALDNQHIFPLTNYNQNIDYWLVPSNPDYNNPLLSAQYQEERFTRLKHRYFGTTPDDVSPWSGTYITALMQESNSIYKAESKFLIEFDNSKISDSNKWGYAPNLRLYPNSWINLIAKNMNLPQFANLVYNKNNRAIAVNNLQARILPSDDPFFYSDKIAGEGYPFDNLQNSAIYAGTPLYIIGKSADGKWLLVLSPDIISWVHTNDVALADEGFINTWQSTAYKAMIGINKNDIGIKDRAGNYLFSGYIGVLLPLQKQDRSDMIVLIPVKNMEQMAEIKWIRLPATDTNILPVAATMANFARILNVMQGRRYSWGGADMYTDCSSELKNIYALFGLYVPRNTKSIDNAGKVSDLSSMPMKERLANLMQHGIPMLTFIHIKGHVMLYVGKYNKSYSEVNGKVGSTYPLSYQQIWGLSDFKMTYRAIIGQSVFFPLLDSYAEDKNLRPTSSSSMFRLIDITHEPDKYYKPDLNELLY